MNNDGFYSCSKKMGSEVSDKHQTCILPNTVLLSGWSKYVVWHDSLRKKESFWVGFTIVQANIQLGSMQGVLQDNFYASPCFSNWSFFAAICLPSHLIIICPDERLSLAKLWFKNFGLNVAQEWTWAIFHITQFLQVNVLFISNFKTNMFSVCM